MIRAGLEEVPALFWGRSNTPWQAQSSSGTPQSPNWATKLGSGGVKRWMRGTSLCWGDRDTLGSPLSSQELPKTPGTPMSGALSCVLSYKLIKAIKLSLLTAPVGFSLLQPLVAFRDSRPAGMGSHSQPFIPVFFPLPREQRCQLASG